MTKWKAQLENFDSMLKELRRKREEPGGHLRFDRSTISASARAWKQNRKATPTTNPNKCSKCEYQTQCQNRIK